MGEEDLGRDFGIPPRAQVWVAHHGWCTTPRPHPSPTSRRLITLHHSALVPRYLRVIVKLS